jgi:hypothetical protein
LLLIQGIFPKGMEAGLDRIPNQQHIPENPVPPVDGALQSPSKDLETAPKILPPKN